MSDYTRIYDGAAKDLAQDPVTGADFDAEFTLIQTADNSKVDKESTQTVTGAKTFTGNNIFSTGTLDLQGTNTISGGLTISGASSVTNNMNVTKDKLQIGGVAVTTTAAELNKLDGATASVTELNYVTGVTSAIQTQMDTKAPIANPTFTGEIGIGAVNVSETELGTLEGITSTTAELNLLDGATVTTAEINILDGVTSTASELNLVDGSVAGTSVASKALVLGTTKNTDVLDVDTTLTSKQTPVYGMILLDTPVELYSYSGTSFPTVAQTAIDLTATINALTGSEARPTGQVASKAILKVQGQGYGANENAEILVGHPDEILTTKVHRAVFISVRGTSSDSACNEVTVNLGTGEIFDYAIIETGNLDGDCQIYLSGYYV